MNQKEENKEYAKTTISWYPGHMAKTKRLIAEKYPLIDIVYEVVDARIPYSSKIKDIYDLIQNKPKIIVMTKKDLCDLKVTQSWIEYYENLGNHVILVDLNKPNEEDKIISLTHELMKSVQRERLSKDMKNKEIRALVIGIPNVGKSTLINRLCKRNVVVTGNMPGVTQNLTWLRTHSDILLLDTPGILWPKIDVGNVALNLAAFTAIKQEVIPIQEVAIYILKTLSEYYPDLLYSLYGIKQVDDPVVSLDEMGSKMGAIKDGETDYNKVCMRIVNDIKLEKIKGITFDHH